MSILKYLLLIIAYSYQLLQVKCSSSIKISVIIPVYNSEDFLSRSVQAIMNQTLKDLEIICIDDASTDRSLQILNEFKEKDSRIKVISMKENKGPSICRNTGINVANGEYVGFMDSDDDVDNRFYENLYNYTANNDMIVGNYVKSINDSDDYIPNRRFGKTVFVWDTIFRRKFLDDNNLRFPTNIRYAEDKIFRENCYKYQPKIFKTPDEGIYYYYKQREGSLCNRGKRYMKHMTRRINRIIKKRNQHKRRNIAEIKEYSMI